MKAPRNTGKPFERRLDVILAQYTCRGLLRAKKAEPPTKVVGPARVIFLENPFLDYIGAWTQRNGRLLMFEAKSSRDPKLPMDSPKSGGLITKQVDALRHWHNAGAVAFVLWEISDRDCYLATWWAINRVLAQGRKHLVPDDCRRVPQGQGFILYDFLPLLHENWPS
jgi:penicillin-binding protein-related factor A (putative recombinase)